AYVHVSDRDDGRFALLEVDGGYVCPSNARRIVEHIVHGDGKDLSCAVASSGIGANPAAQLRSKPTAHWRSHPAAHWRANPAAHWRSKPTAHWRCKQSKSSQNSKPERQSMRAQQSTETEMTAEKLA